MRRLKDYGDTTNQKERKLRGIAAEEILKDVLPDVGCNLVRQYKGGEHTDKNLRPDFDVVCNGVSKTIEVKETVILEKDRNKKGERTYRTGRWQLSPDGKTKSPHAKDCYALMVDDFIADVVTVDFIKADKIDAEFSRLAKTGRYPKLPIHSILSLREHDRCFADVGTLTVPREEMMAYLDKSLEVMYTREKRRRHE